MSYAVEYEIRGIVDSILADFSGENSLSRLAANSQPNKGIIVGLIGKLQRILFPAHFGDACQDDFTLKYHLGAALEEIYTQLSRQTSLALLHSDQFVTMSQTQRETAAGVLVQTFMEQIPRIRELLKMDVQAAFDGDPAAYNRDEIIFSYPGLYAIMVNRLAHELYLLKIPLIPRIMTEHAHSLTGIDIHPGATIGKYFFIDHGTGVVVGETTTIGDRVKIYQGVTLGALSTRAGQGLKDVKRHPTIGNDVTIYSGASILGGDTVIGEDVIVGGNCFITESVPAHTRVSIRNPELQMRSGDCAASSSGFEE